MSRTKDFIVGLQYLEGLHSPVGMGAEHDIMYFYVDWDDALTPYDQEVLTKYGFHKDSDTEYVAYFP